MSSSIRNVRKPTRYIDYNDHEDVLGDESPDEYWTCQECLNDDDGVARAAYYAGRDTCECCFTKSVLKSLNLMFSHANFVQKLRKQNASVNIVLLYFLDFLILLKIVFIIYFAYLMFEKISKTLCKAINLLKSSIKH